MLNEKSLSLDSSLNVKKSKQQEQRQTNAQSGSLTSSTKSQKQHFHHHHHNHNSRSSNGQLQLNGSLNQSTTSAGMHGSTLGTSITSTDFYLDKLDFNRGEMIGAKSKKRTLMNLLQQIQQPGNRKKNSVPNNSTTSTNTGIQGKQACTKSGVAWISGPFGVGKTRLVHETFSSHHPLHYHNNRPLFKGFFLSSQYTPLGRHANNNNNNSFNLSGSPDPNVEPPIPPPLPPRTILVGGDANKSMRIVTSGSQLQQQQHQDVLPFSAILQACNQICQLLLEGTGVDDDGYSIESQSVSAASSVSPLLQPQVAQLQAPELCTRLLRNFATALLERHELDATNHGLQLLKNSLPCLQTLLDAAASSLSLSHNHDQGDDESLSDVSLDFLVESQQQEQQEQYGIKELAAVGTATTDQAASCKCKNKSLHFALKAFWESLSDALQQENDAHPDDDDATIVLHLDNLHLADQESLDLIADIFLHETDPLKHFLLVTCSTTTNQGTGTKGACNLASSPSSLDSEARVDALLSQSPCLTTQLSLTEFTDEETNQFIAQALRMEPEDTQDLTTVVVDKTKSRNALLLSEFISVLAAEQCLTFHFATFQWHWDLNAIRNHAVSACVADMVLGKILNTSLLSEMEKKITIVASFVATPSFTFDLLARNKCVIKSFSLNSDNAKREDTQEHEGTGDKEKENILTDKDLIKALKKLVACGFLLRDPQDKMRFTFAHDHIQQGVSNALPIGIRGKTKRRIGRNLRCFLKRSSAWNGLIFNVADLMNAPDEGGEADCTDNTMQDRLDRAQVLYEAAEEARKSSAFASASHYAREAMLNLPHGHWKNHYKMSLGIYELASHAAYSIGDVELCIGLAEEVLYHAEEPGDRSASNFIKARAMVDANRLQEAKAFILDVLSNEYKCRLRRDVSNKCILCELGKTKLLLRNKSDNDLLRIENVKSPRCEEAVEFLGILVDVSMQIDPLFLPIIVFKWIRMIIRTGHSQISSHAFGMYGALHCSMLQNFDEAMRFAKLAEQLMVRASTEKKTRVRALTQLANNALIYHWKRPAKQLIRHFVEGYKLAMSAGAIRLAAFNLLMHCEFSFGTAGNLVELEARMRAYIAHLQDYHMENNLNMLLPMHQCVLNLLGAESVQNPAILSGESMDYNELMEQTKAQHNAGAEMPIRFYQLYVSYQFGDFKMCRKILREIRAFHGTSLSLFISQRFEFLKGLVAIKLSRSRNRRMVRVGGRWDSVARNTIDKIQSWVKKGNVNVLHKLYLLQAEKLVSKIKSSDSNTSATKQMLKAKEKYDAAISIASKSGFLQDKALACELAGKAYSRVGKDEEWASFYLDQARTLYSEWGAFAKVRDLDQNTVGCYSAVFSGSLSGSGSLILSSLSGNRNNSNDSNTSNSYSNSNNNNNPRTSTASIEYLISPRSSTIRTSIINHDF